MNRNGCQNFTSIMMKGFFSLVLSLFYLRSTASMKVCITTQYKCLVEIAEEVGKDLIIPYSSLCEDTVGDEYSHVIEVLPFRQTYALGIRVLDPPTKKGQRLKARAGSPKPHIVDFCPPKDSRLAQRLMGGADMLIKAVGPRKVEGGARIYDLTAGFGQDSLLMLQSGASEVCMVERDPIVASLLQDALRRRDMEGPLDRAQELSLKIGNSADIVKSLSPDELPDVCYVDPMFPPRTKSAAVKKNIQILHSLLGSQEADEKTLYQEVELLKAALNVATTKVVVKRPIHAPPLGALSNSVSTPTYDLRGSVSRWDVYMIK